MWGGCELATLCLRMSRSAFVIHLIGSDRLLTHLLDLRTQQLHTEVSNTHQTLQANPQGTY
jgi:hypothetical protein